MKTFFKNLWNDESGQGMTEYILLLVIIVAVVMMFGGEIRPIIESKISELSDSIGQVGQ